MTATTAPTGASMPSPTFISASIPDTVAGTSIDVLSVSISNRSSPGLILSPTFLNQRTIFPELTVSPSCGINMSMVHQLRRPSSLPSETTTHRLRYTRLVGQNDVFERVGRRQRQMRRRDAHQRAVEIVESLVGYDRHDLRAPAAEARIFLDREDPVGACD